MKNIFPDLSEYKTLFLDRDGVINVRIPNEYVNNIDKFVFTENATESIAILNKYFDHVIIVSNQQGVGKELMDYKELEIVNNYMLEEIVKAGGNIDAVYYCTALANENHPERKPNTGMALRAVTDFPEIKLNKSLMVGDSVSDMQFAINSGMKPILIKGKTMEEKQASELADMIFHSLKDFANYFIK